MVCLTQVRQLLMKLGNDKSQIADVRLSSFLALLMNEPTLNEVEVIIESSK